MALLHEAIDRVAATDPERPALYFADQVLTFGQLSRRAEAAAGAVASMTAPGGGVAMVGENHPSWVEAYYGVPRAGRVLVFLNHRLAPAELAAILRRSGATVLVGPAAELDKLRPLAAEFPEVTTVLDLEQWDALLDEGPGDGDGPTPPEEVAPAWLIYTSGTTGSPKGATLTHRNFAASLLASEWGRPIGADDVFLYPFPLCHVSGYNVLRILAGGRPVVLIDRYTPGEFVALVGRHRVTHATMPATMLSSLLDHLDEHPDERSQLATWRALAYGAAPMPPTLLRRAFDDLRIDFTQGYGMTELAGNATFLGIEEHHRALAGDEALLTTCGRPAPNVEIRVVDDDDHEVPVGERGEIVVRGDQVTVGYWRDEATTAQAFTGGWFHTGDVGVFDTEGLLSVVDRKKDVIVTGAENVSSREVEEEILRSCPEVREVAVVAVSDPHWGENVCAVVVLRPGTDLAAGELIRRVRLRLAGFKAPRHVVRVDELPKNSTGKIVKQELRTWLAEHPDLVGERY